MGVVIFIHERVLKVFDLSCFTGGHNGNDIEAHTRLRMKSREVNICGFDDLPLLPHIHTGFWPTKFCIGPTANFDNG